MAQGFSPIGLGGRTTLDFMPKRSSGTDSSTGKVRKLDQPWVDRILKCAESNPKF